ncbi:Uncharacterised protein [Pseudomonas aeruginosa]|nr:Uncharacterised protein [Pseudomonas aeruginosa]
MTKPSRAWSKGREARSGLSLKSLDRARAAAKPARLTRWTVASAPPQSATSTSPARIIRAASPMACTPAAQAVTGAPSGPLKPWRIDTWAAAMLQRKDGMVKGDRRRGPLPSVVRTASAMAWKPPTPEAMTVAVRSCASALCGAQPAWARASCAAARAKRMKRSILRCSLAASSRSGSKPACGSWTRSGTWPPMLMGRSPISSAGSVAMPDCPASRRCHMGSTPQPSGLTAPMPVTTIRLLMRVRVLLFRWNSSQWT